MNLNITAHLWINASYESHWYGFEPFCALWSEIPSRLSCSTVWKSQTSVWGQPGFTFIHLGNTTSLEKPHALILKVELLLTSFLQINWCETPPPWWRWFSFTFSTLGLDWEIPAQLLLHLFLREYAARSAATTAPLSQLSHTFTQSWQVSKTEGSNAWETHCGLMSLWWFHDPSALLLVDCGS